MSNSICYILSMLPIETCLLLDKNKQIIEYSVANFITQYKKLIKGAIRI